MSMDYITHELRSRMIQDHDRLFVIEYDQLPWTQEVVEVDQTFHNGYFGIFAVAKLLPALAIPDALCDGMISDRRLLATAHGYHAGKGIWNHIIAQNIKLRSDVEVLLLDDPPSKIDLYHGIAGDLLAAAIVENIIDLDITRTIRTCLNNVAEPMIRTGFAHGSIGICFALLAVASRCDSEISVQVREAVYPVILRSIEMTFEGRPDFALCSNSMTSVIVALYFDKIFSVKTLPTAKTLALVDMVNNFFLRNTVRDAPLHLCCGIAGLIDILLEVSRLSGENLFQESAHEIAHRYLIESNLIQLTSTGIFHGLSGVAYQLARLDSSFSNGKVLPSLFFPSITCSNSSGD